MQAGKEEGKVGKARVVHLGGSVSSPKRRLLAGRTKYGSVWSYIRDSEGASRISSGKEPFHMTSCRARSSLGVVIVGAFGRCACDTAQ